MQFQKLAIQSQVIFLYISDYKSRIVSKEANTKAAIHSQTQTCSIIQKDVQIVTLAQNTTTVDQQIFEGDLPRRLIIVQVLQDAYNGDYRKNPLDFQNFSVQRISVNMNGRSYPIESNEMKMNFESDNVTQAYIMAFIQLYDSEFEDLEGLQLIKDNYINGYFMYPIALTAGNQKPPHGLLRLKMDYAVPLPSPIVVLVFAEYERTLDMDAKGIVNIK